MIYYQTFQILNGCIKINDAINLNSIVRNEINDIIGKQWKNKSSDFKKNFMKKSFMNNTQVFKEYTDMFNNEHIEKYDFVNDEVGSVKLVELIPNYFYKNNELQEVNIFDFLNYFKDIVENNNGALLLNANGSFRRESYCQKLFHLCMLSYYNKGEIDISPEVNSGRGPLDFKIVSKNLKYAIEIKKLSSTQYKHGINTQLPEYGKAEKIKNLIYLAFSDVEDIERRNKRIQEINDEVNNLKADFNIDVIIIDGLRKKSASKY